MTQTLMLTSLAGLLLTACAAQTPTSTANDVKPLKPYATVKPGAAVTLSTDIPKTMAAGGYEAVGLKFSERYGSGNLDIRVVPSEGLSLFAGRSEATFDMAAGGSHEMALDVSAETDGVYFLNVFAEAGGQARTFSVQLEIGQVTEAMKKSAITENGEMKDGLRVMEAEETIR